jgi:hypothetical protein
VFSESAISNQIRYIIETSIMEALTVDRHPLGLIEPLERKDWKTALTVILHSPHWTKRLSLTRCFPLHAAYHTGAPIEVVTALLEAYPDATNTRNAWNNRPCHTACSWGVSSEGMKVLLRCNPDAASAVNQFCETGIQIINNNKWKFFADEKEQVMNDLKQDPSFWKSKEQQALLQCAFEETDRRRSMRRSVARIVLGRQLDIDDLVPLIIEYL